MARLSDVQALAVATSGASLLVAGSFGHGFSLTRLGDEGAQDTAFGSSGYAEVEAEPGGFSQAEDLAVQSDGRILAAGYGSYDPADQYHGQYCEACATPLVIRFLEDGEIDPGFGAGGIARLQGAGGGRIEARGESLALAPGGDLLVGGRSADGSGVVVGRLHADGTADRAFGLGGVSTVEPCAGGDAARVKARCLPAVRARLHLRRRRSRPPMLVLKVKPSLGWARMEAVHLLAPPGLGFRPSARSTVSAQLTEPESEGGEIGHLEVHPHRLTIDGNFGLRSASMRVPVTAFSGLRHAAIPPRLKFRIRVSWPIGYGFYKSETIVSRRVG